MLLLPDAEVELKRNPEVVVTEMFEVLGAPMSQVLLGPDKMLPKDAEVDQDEGVDLMPNPGVVETWKAEMLDPSNTEVLGNPNILGLKPPLALADAKGGMLDMPNIELLPCTEFECRTGGVDLKPTPALFGALKILVLDAAEAEFLGSRSTLPSPTEPPNRKDGDTPKAVLVLLNGGLTDESDT